MYSGDRAPCRRRFSRDQALPRTVRGPVDFFALRWLEARRAGVRVGDLRKDMVKPTFQHPTLRIPTILLSREQASVRAYNLSPGGKGPQMGLLLNAKR